MRPIRVFIISDSLLFVRGLKSLLSHEPRLEIIGEETSIDRAIEQIEVFVPDVIIWSDSGRMSISAPEEMHLLKAKPGIKVIGLSLTNNDLFIYRSTQRHVKSVEDLVEAIEFDLYSAESSDPQ